jgi:hypothetical protein
MFTRPFSVAVAFTVTALVTQNAAAQFARPPGHDDETSEPTLVDAGSRHEDDDGFDFAPRSTARLHVGPATLFSPATPGLFTALDIGRRSVGARFSGAWLGAENEGGIAQYGAELWVDFAGGSQLHPIVSAGAAYVRHREDDESDQRGLGAGVLRGTLEYELPVRDADARVGLSLIGLVPAIESERQEPWVMGALTVGAGF